jgi:four helix bundle protein
MNITSSAGKQLTFDHEKLFVYRELLRFITWVTPLIEEPKMVAREKSSEVCDQLDRASLSALLNTAEGNGKRQGQVRAKFFDDAPGSTTERAACLDALVAKGIFQFDPNRRRQSDVDSDRSHALWARSSI